MSDIAGKNRSKFSIRLEKLRIKKGITQKELANRIHENESKISLCVNDKQTPDAQLLCKIADFFHVSTDYLLGRTNTSTNNPAVQSAVAYTGLSERTLYNIHKLSKCEDEFKALDYLLSTNNEAKLLLFLDAISACRKATRAETDAAELQMKVDTLNAAIDHDGLVCLSADKAAQFYAQQAAWYLMDLCLRKDGKHDGKP